MENYSLVTGGGDGGQRGSGVALQGWLRMELRTTDR